MKIALLNSKGGCAKTTSAVFLAQVAHNRGLDAEIWDMDPQASATPVSYTHLTLPTNREV